VFDQTKNRRVCIIGAGLSGKVLASEILTRGTFGELVALIDDDEEKIGDHFVGIPILGPVADIGKHLEATPADEAIIAIPNASRKDLERIYAELKKAGISTVRILPRLSQIIDSPPHLIQTREINPQDFLGREPAAISLKKSLAYLRGRRVLITGAGGSIGSELSRQLLYGGAQRLYLFDHGENSLYEIEKDLKLLQNAGVGEAASIVPIVGELKDRAYMDFILKRLNADVVFHCAAYKHVPMTEANPIEAIKNNVFGTKNLVEAALDHSVSRFVLISTDKAADPVCVYGASKMLAEEIVLHASTKNTHFMVVRFGNVLGSRGSIVPLFRDQIANGGPVTVTDPNASRFFMTLPESASLVLKAGGIGDAGELYILDMGEPIMIRDLAEQMIRFYGFVPGEDIKIEYTGLRPGDILNETLFSADETPEETPYPLINRLIRKPRFDGELDAILDLLKPICDFDPSHPTEYRNRKLLRDTLRRFIPTIRTPENEPEY
jgi:FlaA1/EpsC-like NDP-sugar epimerase